MQTFELHDDYIELCRLLKILGLCSTGGEAKVVIDNGMVTVDGAVETRKRCKIRRGSRVEYGSETIVVK